MTHAPIATPINAALIAEIRRHEALAIVLRGLAEHHERHATDDQIAALLLINAEGDTRYVNSLLGTWEAACTDMFRNLRSAVRRASPPPMSAEGTRA